MPLIIKKWRFLWLIILFFFRNIVLQAENEREKDEVMEKLLKVFFVFKIVIISSDEQFPL